MITYASYDTYAELTGKDFVIVDFFTETCGPCKLFSKILEDVTFDCPFVNVVKVNLTQYPKLGADIEAVPTVHFMKDGTLRHTEVGLMTRDEVLEKISEIYYG